MLKLLYMGKIPLIMNFYKNYSPNTKQNLKTILIVYKNSNYFNILIDKTTNIYYYDILIIKIKYIIK